MSPLYRSIGGHAANITRRIFGIVTQKSAGTIDGFGSAKARQNGCGANSGASTQCQATKFSTKRIKQFCAVC